jgi:hypothetical protein
VEFLKNWEIFPSQQQRFLLFVKNLIFERRDEKKIKRAKFKLKSRFFLLFKIYSLKHTCFLNNSKKSNNNIKK